MPDFFLGGGTPKANIRPDWHEHPHSPPQNSRPAVACGGAEQKGVVGEKATLQIPRAAVPSSCFFCPILPLGADLGEEEEEETVMGRWKIFLLLF